MKSKWSLLLCSLLLINFNQFCCSCLFGNLQKEYYNLLRLKHLFFETNKIEYDEESYILYFSICQSSFQNFYFPLNNSDSVKPNNSLGMIVKKKKLLPPIFIYFETISHVYDNSLLILKLESQKSCETFTDSKYSVLIYFICSKEKEEFVFDFLNKSHCSFKVEWHTSLGCSINFIPPKGFSLKMNHSLDLMPFQHFSYYKVSLAEKETDIYLNFFGPVKFEDCYSKTYGSFSLCVIKNNKTYVYPQESFYYSEEKLIYKIKTNHTVLLKDTPSVEIDIKCNKNIFNFHPTVSTKKHTFKVSFESYLACTSNMNYEVFDDEHNLKYTLPQITKEIKTENFIFLLNTSNRFASFAISRKNFEIINLGSLRNLQINDKNHSLDLIYTLGSIRPKMLSPCSSKISFVCSEKKTDPILVGQFLSLSDCKFHFVANDPAVCPVSASRNCAITESKYAYNFILPDDVFEIHHKELVFKINLCGQLQESCNGSTAASVCLIKKNQEIIIGRRSSQYLTYQNGSLRFELTGDTHNSNIPIQVFVEVICDYGVSISKPFFVFHDSLSSDYVFNFSWRTKQACPEEETFDCLVKNTKGETIDLKPLRKTSSNYHVRKDASSWFLLNFCGSLWFGNNEICRRDSAVCLVENGHFKKVGFLNNKKIIVGKGGEVTFIFKMEMYETCPNGTRITFQCDEENKDPEYIGFENCNYSFIWKTSHACFKRNQSKTVQPNESEGKKNFNLSVPLENHEFFQIAPEKSTENKFEFYKDINFGKKNQNEAEVYHIFPNNSTKTEIKFYKDINIANRNQREFFKDEISKSTLETDQLNKSVIIESKVPLATHKNTSDSNFVAPEKKNSSNSILIFLNIRNNSKIPGEICLTNFSCLVLGSNKSANLNYTFLKRIPFFEKPKSNSECDEVINKAFISSKLSCQTPCNGDICIKKKDSWISGGVVQQTGPYNQNSKESIITLRNGDRCSDKGKYSSQIELKCSDNYSEVHSKLWNWFLEENDCSFTVKLISPLFCLIRSESSSSNKTIIAVIIGTIVSLIFISFFLVFFFKKKNNSICFNKTELSSQTNIPLIKQGRKCSWKDL